MKRLSPVYTLFLRYYLFFWLIIFVGVMVWVIQPWNEEYWLGPLIKFGYGVFVRSSQISFVPALFFFISHSAIKGE